VGRPRGTGERGVHVDGRWAATYDGRATAGENWEERTGLSYATTTPGVFAAQGSVPVAQSPHAGRVCAI
jgi:hypothetical protein